MEYSCYAKNSKIITAITPPLSQRERVSVGRVREKAKLKNLLP
jgi:hypothetical protein